MVEGMGDLSEDPKKWDKIFRNGEDVSQAHSSSQPDFPNTGSPRIRTSDSNEVGGAISTSIGTNLDTPSKLEQLRARNRNLRKTGSEQIARTRLLLSHTLSEDDDEHNSSALQLLHKASASSSDLYHLDNGVESTTGLIQGSSSIENEASPVSRPQHELLSQPENHILSSSPSEVQSASVLEEQNRRLRRQLDALSQVATAQDETNAKVQHSSRAVIATEKLLGEAKITSLEQEIGRLKEDLRKANEYKGKALKMEQALQDFQTTNQDLLRRLGKTTVTKIKEQSGVEGPFEAMSSRIEDLEKENTKLKQNLQFMQREADNRQEVDSEVRRRSSAIATTERETAEAKMAALELELEHLQSEADLAEKCKERLEKLELELRESEKEHDVLIKKLVLQGKEALPRSETEEAQIIINSLERENNYLMARVKEVEKSTASRHQIENHIQRSSTTMMATERALAEAKTSALEAEIENLQDEYDRMKIFEDKVVYFEAEIKAEHSKTTDLKSKLTEFDEGERIQSLHKENKKLERQVKHLEKEAQSRITIQAQIRRSSSVVLNTERAMADAKYSALEAEIETVQEQIKEENEKYAKQKTTLEGKIKDAKSKNLSLLKTTEYNSAEMADPSLRILEQEQKRLKHQLKKLLTENEAHKDIANQVRRSSSTMVATERAMAKAKIAALETELKGRQEELEKGEAIQKELADLVKQIKASQEISTDIGKRIFEKTGEKEAQRSQDVLLPRIEEIEKENNILSKELGALKKKLSERNAIQAQLQRSSTAMAATERALTNAKVSALESEIECLREKLDAAETYKRRVVSLEAAVEDSQRKGDDMVTKLVGLSRVNGGFNLHSDARKRAHFLERENDDIRKQLAAAKKKELEREEIEIQVQRSSSAMIATERSISEAKVAAKQAEIEALNKQIDDGSQYKQQAEQLNKRLKETQKRNQSMVSRLGVSIIKRLVIQSGNSGENVLEDDLRFTLNSLQQENRGLKKELKAVEDATSSRAQMNAKIRRSSTAMLKTERALAEAKISALESELENLEENLQHRDRYSEKIEFVQTQLQEQESNHSQLVKRLVNSAKDSNVSLVSRQDSEEIIEARLQILSLEEQKLDLEQILNYEEADLFNKEFTDLYSTVFAAATGPVRVDALLKLEVLEEHTRDLEWLLDAEEAKLDLENNEEISVEEIVAEGSESKRGPLESELLKLREELESASTYREQFGRLESELKQAEAKNINMIEKLSSQSRATGFPTLSAEVQARIESLEEENFGLKHQLKKFKRETVSRDEIDFQIRRSSNAMIATERALANARYSALESELEGVRKVADKFSYYRKQVEIVESKLENSRNNNLELVNRLDQNIARDLENHRDESGGQMNEAVRLKLQALQDQNRILKKQLKSREEVVTSQDQIDSQRRRSSSAMIGTERAMAEARYSALEAEVEKLQEEIEINGQYESQTQTLEAELQKLQVANDVLTKRLVEYSTKATAENPREKLLTSLKFLEDENADLRDKLKSLRDAEKTRSKLDEDFQQSSVAALSTERSIADAKYTALEATLESLLDELEETENFKEEVAKLEAELREEQKKCEGILSHSYINKSDTEGSEKMRLKSLQEQNKELEKKLKDEEKIKISREKLETQVRRSSNVMISTERTMTEAKLTALEMELQSTETDLKDQERAREKCDALRVDLLAVEHQKSELMRTLIESSNHEGSQEATKLRSLEKKNRSLKEEIKVMKKEAKKQSEIETQVKRSSSAMIATERALSEANISSLESDIQNLEEEVERELEKTDEYKAQAKSLEVVLLSIQEANRRMIRRLGVNITLRLREEAEGSQGISVEKQKYLDGLERENKHLKKELSSANATATNRQQMDEKIRRSSTAMIATERALASAKFSALEAEINDLKEDLEETEDFKAQIDLLRDQLKAAEHKSENLISRLVKQSSDPTMASPRERAQARIQELTKENKEMKTKIQTAQEEAVSTDQIYSQENRNAHENFLRERSLAEEKISALERRRDQALDEVDEINRKKEELEQLSTVLKEVASRNKELEERLNQSQPIPKGAAGEDISNVIMLQRELGRLREKQEKDTANAKKKIETLEAENVDLKHRLQALNQKSFTRRISQIEEQRRTSIMITEERATVEAETTMLEAELDRLEEELADALEYEERVMQLEKELQTEQEKNMEMSKMIQEQSYEFHESTAQIEAWDKIKFLEAVNRELKQKLKESQKETVLLKEISSQNSHGGDEIVSVNGPHCEDKPSENLSGKIEYLEKALFESKARTEDLVTRLEFEEQSNKTKSEGVKKQIQDLDHQNRDLKRRMKELEQEALSQEELFAREKQQSIAFVATEQAASAAKYARLDSQFKEVREALEAAIQYKEEVDAMALELEKSKSRNDQFEKELRVIGQASFWENGIGSSTLSVGEIVKKIEAYEERVTMENEPKLAKPSRARSSSNHVVKIEDLVVHFDSQQNEVDDKEKFIFDSKLQANGEGEHIALKQDSGNVDKKDPLKGSEAVDRQTLQQTARKQQKELDEARCDIASLSDQVSTLESELENLKVEKERLLIQQQVAAHETREASADGRESYLTKELASCRSRLQEERHLLSCLSTELNDALSREALVRMELSECFKKLWSISEKHDVTDKAGFQAFPATQQTMETLLVEKTLDSHPDRDAAKESSDIAKLKTELEHAREENEGFHSQMQSLQDRIDELEGSLALKEKHEGLYHKRVNDMHGSVASVTGVLEEMTDSNKSLAARIAELESELSKERQSKLELISRNTNGKSQPKTTMTAVSGQMEKTMAQNMVLSKEVDLLVKKIALATNRPSIPDSSTDPSGASELRALRYEYDLLQVKQEELEQKCIESNEALLHAREKADQAVARLKVLETKLEAADSELESLRKSSRKTESDLRLEIQRGRDEVSQQDFANDTLKELIVNLNKMNDDLRAKENKLTHEMNHLRTQNKNFTQSISKLQAFSETMKHGDIEKEFLKLSDECKFLRNQKKGFLRDIAKYEKQLGVIANERDAVRAIEKDLKARVDALAMANQRLEQKLEQKDARIAKKLEDSFSRNKWLDGQLAEAQKMVSELTLKNEALNEENSAADLFARETGLAREVTALRHEVEVSRKNLTESVAEEEKWKKTLEGLRSELVRVSKEKKALLSERDSLRYILDSIEAKRKEKTSSKPKAKEEQPESKKSSNSFWGF